MLLITLHLLIRGLYISRVSGLMEMILTGAMIDANKAERDGLISRVIEWD